MGERPAAGAVANRIDVRGGGALVVVGLDPATLVEDNPAVERPRPETVGARPTATSIRSASTLLPSPKRTVRAPPDSVTPVHC